MDTERERNLKKIVEKEKGMERKQTGEDKEKTQLNDDNRQILSEQVRYENADDLYN